MQIRFVGHAGFTVSSHGVEVLCDPWLGGRVFHDGWDMYSPVDLTLDDLPDVKYLWFSHEHPDHFHVPTLRAIEPGRRAEITVLFQDTLDHRVAEFCRGLGFKDVVEMPDQWLTLDGGLDVLCAPFQEGNSWIAFRDDASTILNLNDCGVRNGDDADAIKDRLGVVDVLLTQFSYAFWVGNPDQRDRRVREAREKLEMVAFQADRLAARSVIPIASYVYFCHPENFYLNDEINTASATRAFLQRATTSKPVILGNGDSYDTQAEWSSDEACRRFDADLERVRAAGPLDLATETVPLAALVEQAAGFVQRLTDAAPWYLRLGLRPSQVYVWDLGHAVQLSRHGLRPSSTSEQQSDAAMHSESLSLCLRFPYGIDTLAVSGRLQHPPGGSYRRFYKLCRPALLAMRGEHVGLRYIARALGNAALVRAGRRRN